MHAIDTIEQLEALYGNVAPQSRAKEVHQLSAEYRRWIEASPFMVLATSGPGGLDCSPRGDPAGDLFHILDERTLAIPDRSGNNRIDSLRNVVADPRVALIFFIPGITETVRINGRARITTDPALTGRFTKAGKTPRTVLVVTIGSVFFQCARALKRARLWDAAGHADLSQVPTAGQMLKGVEQSFDAEAYDAGLPERQASTLY